MRRLVLFVVLTLGLGLLAGPAWSWTVAGSPVTPGGSLVVWGDNSYGQLTAPSLPAGVRWSDAVSSSTDTLLVGLTSTGQVKAWGWSGDSAVPALPAGQTYVGIAAGDYAGYAIRSDGTIAVWGSAPPTGTPPALPAGTRYVQVAAGGTFALALRSDGQIVGWGDNTTGSLTIPALPAGVTYQQVAAGDNHGVGLRSDGQVVSWGSNFYGQTGTPALPAGVTYTKIVAQGLTSFALRSDGHIAAWGDGELGDLQVPALPAGVVYTDVGTRDVTGYAFRSDGQIATWGQNTSPYYLATVPAAPAGTRYGLLGGGRDNGFGILQTVPVVTATATTGTAPVVSVHVTAPGLTPTGRVVLMNGATPLAQGDLSGGSATLVVPSSLGAGQHALSIVYGGDDAVAGTTVPVTVTVTSARALTSTRLTVPRHRHRRVVVTVLVSPGADGRVTIYQGKRALGSADLIAGRAVIRLRRLSPGVHRISAWYSGSASFWPSHSRVVKVSVP